jgi:AraC-like DNA-binding protein
MTLDTSIRLLVIGQEILLALVCLAGIQNTAGRISCALLMLSVAGYLVNSSLYLRDALAVLRPVIILLAIIVPFCLWSFSRAIFEFRWANKWLVAAVLLSVVVTWVIFINSETLDPRLVGATNVFMHILSLIVLVHALWWTLAGRRDDLIERRRLFRIFFVVIVAAQIFAVLSVELLLGNNRPPAWLELTNTLIIAAMTIGLAIPLLRLNPDFIAPEPVVDRSGDERIPPESPASSVLRQKLLDLMESGYYRESGLTIRVLADTLGYPEHQLRALINGQLGYRNFSAFLNGYRIAAAQQELADPERARTPVLTIALELGYGSLGPFNRAFKARTSMTPTDFRRAALVG